VIGLRFQDKTAFICEATTHTGGMLIVNPENTIRKIREKHVVQQVIIDYRSK